MPTKPGILVVDDEPDSLSLLKQILVAQGYEVRSADSGRLALASISGWLPELIILDIRMPEMDGFEVLSRLQAAERSRSIPVIFLSAASDVPERVKGLTLGAVDYINKPFERQELLARVRTHVELSRLREKLEKEVCERTAELSTAVDQLRESEQRFRNVADTAPVMIWASGPDKLCTFFNKTWLNFTGRTMEEELGNGWLKGVHPDDAERCQTVYESAFDFRQSFEIEYRLRSASDEFRWVLDRGIPRFAGSGAFVGYIGSAVDITDLKRTQEEAIASQKLQSMLVMTRGIAHDFNNLLGAILAQAELAETDMDAGSAPAEQIRHISAVAVRASEIVRQLMIFSGQQEPALESIDLSTLIREMSEILTASIPKRCLLQADLGRDLPPVQGNAAQIRQLVMNLIINAAEAIGEKSGVIRVRTSIPLDTGFVRLEVSDTGCGMTEKEKSRIFDPFFTTKPTGHGLGLAVVHGIVQSHKGVIGVVSSPGRGTTFEVLLRGAPEGKVIPPPSVKSKTARLPPNSGTVLIVEDEDALRLAAEMALHKAGLSLISAANGLGAVEIFRARAADIDVVVLDLTLPGLSGLEVFRQVRAVRPDVEIVITSAHDASVAAAALLQDESARFLQKPYKLSDLVRTIHDTKKRASAAAPDRALRIVQSA